MNRNDLLTLAQRLREYNHNPHHINPTSEAFHKLIDEAASALSILATPPAAAADMGGQAGEEVEVMAYAVDHPEAGYKVYKQFSQWMNGGEWRCDSLMTVAQHERILAAWQRAQSVVAVVPDALREAVEYLDDNPFNEIGAGSILHRAMRDALAAAPAQPAAQGEFGDAYQGAREDLAIWKRRALEAEAKVRHQDQIIDHLTLEAQGESRMGEPFIPAAHDQGEAERILSAEDVRMACQDAIEVFAEQPDAEQCREAAEYMREVLLALIARRTALAASTGQEVEK